MFSFFKKTPSSSNFTAPFATDMHCHILPGIDDGAEDIAASLELIRGLKTMGIHSAIATPHIISDTYPNNPETIGAAHAILQKAIEEASIDFKLNYAAEYLMDDHFFSLIKKGEKLLTIKDNIILTEFSFASAPVNAEEMIFSIINAGYRPILAHPERYNYFNRDFKMYDRMAELGFLLQINLSSFAGYYGNDAKKAAHYIVKKDLLSFLGTDVHHARGLSALTDNLSTFSKVFEDKKFNSELSF